VAVIVGLPALRIRGLFLAITTFAFAIAIQSVLFNPDYFGWLLPDSIDRPTLFLLDFTDETSMYFLCVGSLLLSIVVVVNLRRSRIGRILIGMRENEANLQSFGVNLLRTKLLAFAVAGALCGFAGSLLAVQQGAVSEASFGAQRSIEIFITTVLGGIGSVPGALLGAVFKAVTEDIVHSDFLGPLIGPGGLLLILFISPGGLIALINSIRDGAIRIIAQRRRIVVPSLFSDIDPEALLARLIPLADPIPNSGLAALPPATRFRKSSELYGEDRLDPAGPLTAKTSPPDLPALTAGSDHDDELVPSGTGGANG
jgi:branched-chain amino acid transport system permease protein